MQMVAYAGTALLIAWVIGGVLAGIALAAGLWLPALIWATASLFGFVGAWLTGVITDRGL